MGRLIEYGKKLIVTWNKMCFDRKPEYFEINEDTFYTLLIEEPLDRIPLDLETHIEKMKLFGIPIKTDYSLPGDKITLVGKDEKKYMLPTDVDVACIERIMTDEIRITMVVE